VRAVEGKDGAVILLPGDARAASAPEPKGKHKGNIAKTHHPVYAV
jgi:hypothetical protein